jgi:hypothetical protein
VGGNVIKDLLLIAGLILVISLQVFVIVRNYKTNKRIKAIKQLVANLFMIDVKLIDLFSPELVAEIVRTNMLAKELKKKLEELKRNG